MSPANTNPPGWRQKAVQEVIEYWINFAYLAFFLVAFTWYRRLILAAYHVQYTNYWFPLIEAAVLAKIIMIGDLLRLGRLKDQRPLIVVALYRTVVFTIWVGAFSLLEDTVRSLFHGRGVLGGVEAIAHRDWHEVLAGCVVAFVAFVPFFAFKEMGRLLGEEKFRTLFWMRRGGTPQ
ncbi:MAG: conserved rane protein of unknown function [candidate division NC10 bacterium]|jgi:hypothetical protein|nr:conserved rane protein of unknown function [candidate division NC10 bacterium]